MAGNGKNIILWYTSCYPRGKSGNSEGLVSIKYSNCLVAIIVSHLVHLRHMHISIVKIPAQSFTCELRGMLSHYHNLWLLLPLANLYVVYFYSHRKDYFVPLWIHCSFTQYFKILQLCVSVYGYIFVYVCLYVCMYICPYVCTSVLLAEHVVLLMPIRL